MSRRLAVLRSHCAAAGGRGGGIAAAGTAAKSVEPFPLAAGLRLATRAVKGAPFLYAIVWRKDARGTLRMDPEASWEGAAPAFVRSSMRYSFRSGEGLIGRTARSGGEGMRVPNVQDEPADTYLRGELAREEGIKGSIALAVDSGTIIELGTRAELPADSTLQWQVGDKVRVRGKGGSKWWDGVVKEVVDGQPKVCLPQLDDDEGCFWHEVGKGAQAQDGSGVEMQDGATRGAAVRPGAPVRVTLAAREELTADTRRFRFTLPPQIDAVGLAAGRHVVLSAEVGGKRCRRVYTPVSPGDAAGYFDIIVKVYFANTDPKFPNGGTFSQYLNRLEVGAEVECMGPSGRFGYGGQGLCHVASQPAPVRVRHIGMIAGGSGVTPMLAVIGAVLRDPADTTQLSLICANRSAEDIILRDHLDQLVRESAGRLRVWHTVDRAPHEWGQGRGFVTEAMVRGHLPQPAEDTVVLVCGPPAMVRFAARPNLQRAGHPTDRVFEL